MRIVVVDDHALVRAGLRAELQGEVEIVGEAADVEGAIAAVHDLEPEVVLLDVHLPGGSGGGAIDVLRACAAKFDRVKFLAISVSDAAEDVVAVIRAGARGYVTKSIDGRELSDAIRRVAGGDAVFSPRLAGFVLDAFRAPATPETAGDVDALTAREQEVMRLIARGYTYREAAGELFISIKTIESHVSAVLRKLQLTSRHELTRWATLRRIV